MTLEEFKRLYEGLDERTIEAFKERLREIKEGKRNGQRRIKRTHS